jgi:hypothetical protein
VCRPLVEASEELARRRNVGGFVVFAGEGADALDRVEQHDGCELDLVVEVAACEMRAAVALEFSTRDVW